MLVRIAVVALAIVGLFALVGAMKKRQIIKHLSGKTPEEAHDALEDEDLLARFDGKPAVLISVYRVGGQDVIEISDAVKAFVEEAQGRMPEGIALTVWQDDSRPLRSRRDTLVRNARSGFLLVLMVQAHPASARRVALVIGNSAYEHATPLANPKNDAEAVSAVLKKLGFEVITGLDLTQNQLEDTVSIDVTKGNGSYC